MTVMPFTHQSLANTLIDVEREMRQLPGEGYISVCQLFKETFCWQSSISSLAPTLRVPLDLGRPGDVNPVIFDQISRLVSKKTQEKNQNFDLCTL